uniref:Reverse transcriptase domain-containing protein n=1 Tax=Tanacetum cinerariifolium TaxID=118510 RepID=A0A699H5H4_TANCI|nr:reverse transcriptase domain-containing protein [Tanacetum cinerariifolium]
MLPVTQIDTFYNGLTLRHRDTINVAAGGTFMKRRPEECYDLIENMIAHHNDWDTSAQRSESSSSITSSSDSEIVTLKAKMAKINKNLMKVLQINQQVKAVTRSCKTYGGPHAYNDCPATVGQTQNVYSARAYNQGGNSYQPQGIITRSGIAYKGPTIPTTSSPPQVVERETEVTNDTMPPTNNRSTKDVQPPVVQVETKVPNFEHVVAPVVEPVEAPISALKPNLKSFADTLILMPKFPSTIKSLLTNKEKLFELARTPLNEHCSVVLLKKLPKKLRNPGKFLIPCDFMGMDECLVLADLGASIYLMPLSVWKKLSLPELSPTFMTHELADRSISRPVGVAEDVSIKIGRALIDVYEGELTLPYKEYSQEVFGFSVSGNPTLSMEPIVSTSSHTLTPFGDSDFLLEETDAFLAIEDEPISLEIDDSYYDSKGDVLFLEEFLNDDQSSPSLHPQELKVVEPKNEKSSFDEPPEVELKDLPPHLEYAFLEGNDKLPVIIAKELKDEEKTALIKEKSHFKVKEGIVLVYKISNNGIEVDKAKVDVIVTLPHLTTVKGVRSFLGHAGFYRRFIQDFSKITRPMTRLLEKDTPFIFSKECIEAFQSLKKKLTEAPILVAPD